MNLLLGLVIAVLFMILLVSIVNETVESFRGRGRRGGWRRGFNPNRYLRRFRRRGFNPHRYVRRFRRGGGWYPRRRHYWYDSFVWPTTWLGWGSCKKGCTPDGCPVPGNNYDECVWASDCYGCYW